MNKYDKIIVYAFLAMCVCLAITINSKQPEQKDPDIPTNFTVTLKHDVPLLDSLANRISLLDSINAKMIKNETDSINMQANLKTNVKTNNRKLANMKTVTERKKSNDNTYVSLRCMATTRKGTQCKRKASAGSNYCWQHQ
jgi:hypothetical protein